MLRRFSTHSTCAAAAAVGANLAPSNALRFCATTTSEVKAPKPPAKKQQTRYSDPTAVPPSQRARPGPYEKVGNIFLVQCSDIPAKHSPHVNAILRSLRFEFKGQWTAHPDIPEVREQLFRVRHCVVIECVSLDEMKLMMAIPEHVTFTDLKQRLPQFEGRGGPSVPYPYVRYMRKFQEERKDKLSDVAQRDAIELKLLDARKQALGLDS